MIAGDIPFHRDNEICGGVIRWRRTVPAECQDLITRCLEVDPDRRCSLQDILSHPWSAREQFREPLPVTIFRMNGAGDQSLTATELQLIKSKFRGDETEAVFASSSPPRPLNNQQTLNMLTKGQQQKRKSDAENGTKIAKGTANIKKASGEAENGACSQDLKNRNAENGSGISSAASTASPPNNAISPPGKSPRWREEKVLAYDESQPEDMWKLDEEEAVGVEEEGREASESGGEEEEGVARTREEEESVPRRELPHHQLVGSLARLAGSIFARRRHNTNSGEQESGGTVDKAEVAAGGAACPAVGSKSGSGIGCQADVKDPTERTSSAGGTNHPSAPSCSSTVTTASISSVSSNSGQHNHRAKNQSLIGKMSSSSSAHDSLFKASAAPSGSHLHHPGHAGGCNRFFYQYNGYCCCGCKIRSDGGAGSDQSESFLSIASMIW